ncbi:MAG: fumarylacetoacetate hydrolase family protein [Woeseiaceae bacterium]|jgi:2-keto-4-pentenoate hydratase
MTLEKKTKNRIPSRNTLQSIAESFVQARLTAAPLDAYPGPQPASLEEAYRIQDIAIDLWPDTVGGWKVGRIPPALEEQYGCDRLAGPIFNKAIRRRPNGEDSEMPVFESGFAAVEAEFVAVIAEDAPRAKTDWSRDDAETMIGELHIGLEIASSPFSAINDLGPTVTASDFGNNVGLIVGPAISDWTTRDPGTLTCEAFLDDRSTGRGGAYTLTGGVTRSVQFMLELAARRGRPLKAGDVIATGQTSGIHEVSPGQVARIDFGDDGKLACKLVAASGRSDSR